MTHELEMPSIDASQSWEDQLAELLGLLSNTQGELLQLLQEKRERLQQVDQPGLAAIAPREQELLEKLQHCHAERQKLLERAGAQGLPSGDLQSLSRVLPDETKQLRSQIREARTRARLLQHQSLTNWVLVQRTLLHLSQMLEIIATGGRPDPTYGQGEHRAASGSLMDHAA